MSLYLLILKTQWSLILVVSKICNFSYRRRVVVLHCTKEHCRKAVYFSKIYYHTFLYDSVLFGANVASISQVRATAVLVLLSVGN
jgi:hypothetical protein